ncbi:MAG TPA: sigma-70 family RNA polymerase sigma factor [Pyrinomonadaceae bacterium]|nr:sigma-70 family RNA polymerase sigma factor [Pyrinomonadaceae bacterium]
MPDRTTDELLVERARGGEESAFLLLYERHRDAIFRFAYRLLGSIELAEDITHDCFLSLIRRPEGFDPQRAPLRSYLYAAARNLAMKHFRSQGRETALDDLTEHPTIPRREEPLRRLLESELITKIQQAVADLPPLQREALVLFEYEGLALNEIAEVVGTDVGAVKSRLHRARARLRDSLSQYLNTDPEIVTLEQA